MLIGSSLNQPMWTGKCQIPIGLGLDYLDQCLGQETGLLSVAETTLQEMGWTPTHQHRLEG